LPVANGGTNASTASITSFNNITGFTASGTTGTTSTNLVFATTPTLVGDVNLSTGNLVIGTDGKGIDFSATSHPAGMTSELLDDYEEGIFTPTIVGSTTSGTGTYSAQVGFYTKIGRQVTVYGRVAITNHTGTGNMLIGGLPYALNLDYATGSIVGTNLLVNATSYPIIFMAGLNSTTIIIEQVAIATGANASVPLDTSCDLLFSITYFAAS